VALGVRKVLINSVRKKKLRQYVYLLFLFLFLFYFENWQRNIRMVWPSISESHRLCGLVSIHLLAMTETL
jgi:hypothetical protein